MLDPSPWLMSSKVLSLPTHYTASQCWETGEDTAPGASSWGNKLSWKVSSCRENLVEGWTTFSNAEEGNFREIWGNAGTDHSLVRGKSAMNAQRGSMGWLPNRLWIIVVIVCVVFLRCACISTYMIYVHTRYHTHTNDKKLYILIPVSHS